MKKVVFVLFVVCLFSFQAQSADLMLPFSGGQTWSCDQENNDTPTHSGDLAYAWDFNMGGSSDLNLPVLAPAKGTIVYAQNSYSGWGNVVIIGYDDGGYGKLAHLQTIKVSEGQEVEQGEQIGACGGTPYWSPHIHYQTQEYGYIDSPSITSSFIDTEEPDRIPKLNGLYTSLNTYNPYNNFKVGKFSDGWRIEPWGTSFGYNFIPFSRPFAITYFHNGGVNSLGHPSDYVHQGTVFEFPGYQPNLGIELPYIQNITNTSGGPPWLTLVLNPHVYNIRMGYLGVVYPIQGRIRDYWRTYYSELGYPACNEYSEIVNGKNYAVQWFERTDNNYVKVTYNLSEGTFNDPATNYLGYGNHLNQSTLENLNCPEGTCGVGGDGGDTTPEPDPAEPVGAEFGESKICYSVNPNNPWECTEEQSVFYTDDAKVYSWIEILNLYSVTNLKWEFFYPNGNLAISGNLNTTNPTEDGYPYYDWWHANYWSDFTNNQILGIYTIKFYLNNILVNTSFFEIKERPNNSDVEPPLNLKID